MEKQRSKKTNELTQQGAFVPPTLVRAKYKDATGVPKTITVQSISRGGICIEAQNQLALGTSLRFLIRIKGKTVSAQGEVTWNSEVKGSHLHGVKFTFMKQEDREWFNSFVMDWAAEQIAQELDFSGLTKPAVQAEAERRSFARLRIPLRVDVGFNEETMLIQTQIFDLSEGGLCLISNFEIKKDQKLHMKLWLEDKNFVSLRGTVKYCVKKVHENRNVNFHGVEFLKLNEAVSQKLVQFLDRKRAQMAAIELSLDDIIAQTKPPELP